MLDQEHGKGASRKELGKPKDSDVIEAKIPSYISRQQNEETEAEGREIGGYNQQSRFTGKKMETKFKDRDLNTFISEVIKMLGLFFFNHVISLPGGLGRCIVIT